MGMTGPPGSNQSPRSWPTSRSERPTSTERSPSSEGISDFGALQEALGRHGGSREIAFIVFDILHLDGRDLRPLPLVERKTILERVVARLPVRSAVQFSSDVTGRGSKFFKLACKRH